MTVHPVGGYSSMPMHMYPFPPGLVPTQPLRSKRRQVKNACTNCQKACKKCDDARPCLRCVKYGIAEECIDSQRKERKKGVKRGPYKKRDGKGNSAEAVEVQEHPPMHPPQGMPPQATPSPMPPYMAASMGYPPGAAFYGQFPAPPTPKAGEAGPGPAYYPTPFYITPVPMAAPGQNGHEGDSQVYPQHPQFFQAAILPYGPPQGYGPYMMHRPDGTIQIPNSHYAPFMYSKPPSAGTSNDVGNMNGRVEQGDENHRNE
ncbi:hypothetical protein CONPUDRAFT_135108 [Coniophora puteana RWD-64-598 SS2]|uniref:Transcription activator of gluconeogenesis ERT1 n=1 Tax=Coniophora puteana (strain RWD-64-598) TaxID=741705 RepID=A0A5M3N1S1_CONPW|nr:uncharacterized protein CONPUDRAFT_135108 [Coniophora puteana RWD-64-598 SS2]EIW85340.1 hypothetical protein CONPUDRAFT_135108 [Coniophora puteana RWD-64-598 SS2]